MYEINSKTSNIGAVCLSRGPYGQLYLLVVPIERIVLSSRFWILKNITFLKNERRSSLGGGRYPGSLGKERPSDLILARCT